ncbi:MAG: hypothetical protein RSB67_00170 [Clostridia bacterium]
MYVKNIKISINKDKRLWIVMGVALLVAIILIIYTVYKIHIENDLNSNIFNDKENIFNINSYKCEYDLTLKSNKNTNTYKILEYYDCNDSLNEKFRFEINNDFGDKIMYILSNNSLKITAKNQINEMILNEYTIKKNNLVSFSTFISLYNDIVENNDKCFLIQIEQIDNQLIYRITFNQFNEESDICKKYDFLSFNQINFSKIELIVNKNNNLPLQYTIYDKNEEMFLDIIYNNFKINTHFDEKLFAI